SGWQFLSSGVKDARAGQGVSFVLLRDGRLLEYRDADAWWSGTLASGVASIDAGTDRTGVNMVDVIFASGVLSEYSVSSGWHSLCSGAQSVSAGALGVTVALLKDGRAYTFLETAGSWTYLGSNIAGVAAGTGAGGGLID